MKYIIYIPARSGSKRIKNKNFKIFYKKPLLFWTIEFALKFKDCSKIIISTDSIEWAKIIKLKYSNYLDYLNISIRPKNLSKDKSNIIDAIKYDNNKFLNRPPNTKILLLQPTSPFRNYNKIFTAIKSFKSSINSSSVSFKEYNLEKHIFTLDKNKIQRNNKYFKANGNFYISTINNLFKSNTFIDKKTKINILNNDYENLDIDYDFQWKIALDMIKNKKLPNHIFNRFAS